MSEWNEIIDLTKRSLLIFRSETILEAQQDRTAAAHAIADLDQRFLDQL